jgi:hypothetical protein
VHQPKSICEGKNWVEKGNLRGPYRCHLVDKAVEFNLAQLTTRKAATLVTKPESTNTTRKEKSGS